MMNLIYKYIISKYYFLNICIKNAYEIRMINVRHKPFYDIPFWGDGGLIFYGGIGFLVVKRIYS